MGGFGRPFHMSKIILFNKPFNVLSQFTDKGTEGSDRQTLSEYIEGTPTQADVDLLSKGVNLNDGVTRPAEVEIIDEPAALWERTPPVRFRKSVPDSWLTVTITEGRNRQVRRMTAAIGFPTLRLIRYSVGNFTIDDIDSGKWRETMF